MPMSATALSLAPLTEAPIPGSDYDTVRRILAFITDYWRDQPSIEEIAEATGLSIDETRCVIKMARNPLSP